MTSHPITIDKNNGTRYTSFGVFIFFFIFLAIAFATPFWRVNRVETQPIARGLWLNCTKNIVGNDTTFLSGWDCDYHAVPDLPHDLRAAQALMAFSLLSCLIGFVLYVIWLCKKEDTGVAFGAGGACLLAGLCNLCGIAIYDAHFADMLTIYKLGWSFYLACVSTFFGTMDGIFTIGYLIGKTC